MEKSLGDVWDRPRGDLPQLDVLGSGIQACLPASSLFPWERPSEKFQ